LPAAGLPGEREDLEGAFFMLSKTTPEKRPALLRKCYQWYAPSGGKRSAASTR